METFYRSIPEFIVKTDDITKLSNRACDNLKLGDEVILLDGDEQTKYNITSKSVNGMKLANITGEAVIEVIYSKEGNVWSYVETITTELGGGTSLKYGYYIVNEETGKLEWVETIPEDYTGVGYYFGDEAFAINYYENGISADDGALITSEGITKLDFASLTRSFNELDETLRGIINDAIADEGANGVACSNAQWGVIKELLDKSLYLSYAGYSLIKSASDGIDIYIFGISTGTLILNGASLEFNYNTENSLLYAKFNEL